MKALVLILLFPFTLLSQTRIVKISNHACCLKIDNKTALGYETDAWLPDTMPVSIGSTMKIYNYNCYFEKNQRFGRVYPDWVTNSKGIEQSDGWAFTATIQEQFRIYLYLYFNGVCIDTATTVIVTAPKQSITANFLKIGDSTTAFGFDHESDSLQSATLGTLTFIGTQTTNGVKHEGRGGWYYNTFVAGSSPFYNSGIDFQYYISHNALANPDIICFRLGINDCTANTAAYTLAEIRKDLELLVDSATSQYPNSLIIVSLTSTCEGSGEAWLESYNFWTPTDPTITPFDNYREKMRGLWKITHNLYQGGRKYSNVQVSYEGLCIDAYNMYNLNDAVHPNDLGYFNYGNTLSNTLNYYYE